MSENNMTYGLGCRPFYPDDRDYMLGNLVSCSGNYPEEYCSPLPHFRLNQGDTSMCVAFALSTARYMYELNDSNNKELLSFSYIYANRENKDYSGEGMVVREALANLVNHGTCYLNSFSDMGLYLNVYRKYLTKRLLLDKEAYPYRISSYYRISTENEIKQAVISTGCAVVAYEVYKNWYDVDYTGKIRQPYGKDYGSHCVLIVGWTKNNEWIILNSWGDKWGDNGIGYAPFTLPRNECWCMLDNIQEVFFNSLKDIEGHWAYNSIMKGVRKGVIKGYEDETFKPDGNITRSEVCAVLAKLANIDVSEYITDEFIDVSINSWYAPYVGYCKAKGYVNGYGNYTFNPNEPIKRGEVCKVLCNVADIPLVQADNKFDDIEGHWSRNYIMTLYTNSIVTGYDNGTFKPEKFVTRAEFVVMLERLSLLD